MDAGVFCTQLPGLHVKLCGQKFCRSSVGREIVHGLIDSSLNESPTGAVPTTICSRSRIITTTTGTTSCSSSANSGSMDVIGSTDNCSGSSSGSSSRGDGDGVSEGSGAKGMEEERRRLEECVISEDRLGLVLLSLQEPFAPRCSWRKSAPAQKGRRGEDGTSVGFEEGVGWHFWQEGWKCCGVAILFADKIVDEQPAPELPRKQPRKNKTPKRVRNANDILTAACAADTPTATITTGVSMSTELSTPSLQPPQRKNKRKRSGDDDGLVVTSSFMRQLVLRIRHRLCGYRVIVVTSEAPDKLVAFCVVTADADCLVMHQNNRRMAEFVGRCVRALQERHKKLKRTTAFKPAAATVQKQTNRAEMLTDMRPLVVSQLTQVPGVSEEIALAIVQSYPTPNSLICLTNVEGGCCAAVDVLSQVVIPTREGKSRKLGKAIAKRLCLIFGPARENSSIGSPMHTGRNEGCGATEAVDLTEDEAEITTPLLT
eukprot:GHVS01028741.1.p1 GENE.GHVS01028741.1~~GHVS01028741.1.p1  ORF type:complete len:486 (+),score=81.70 GHVS01028741.1:132-1589(+)